MPDLNRDILYRRLSEDLIGPYTVDEILDARPSDVYLTGILWPFQTLMGGEDNEKFSTSGPDGEESADSGEAEEVSLSNVNRPSTAGISFAAESPDHLPEVKVKIVFATYEPQGSKWQRHSHTVFLSDVVIGEFPTSRIDLAEYGAPEGVKMYQRAAPWKKGWLATFTLVNEISLPPGTKREGIESNTLFQVGMEIHPKPGTSLIARPSGRSTLKGMLHQEDLSTALLYRDAYEYATGHTCSATWESGSRPRTASFVATTWIPSAIVPAFNPEGHDIFKELRMEKAPGVLSADWLAGEMNDKNLGQALLTISETYGKWIELQKNKIPSIEEHLREQAEKNLNYCRIVRERMKEGALLIRDNPAIAEAFRLANRAMVLQHSWDREKSGYGPLVWRPFQIGFILLAISSVADKKHPHRHTMDLLWFPTGGGKTEAYLALIAFLTFHRRLSFPENSDKSSGVAAVMRYTLRLLTTQQFVRAASMILACETIRRGKITSVTNITRFGTVPFSIGLWVGGDATPNTFKEAKDSLSGMTELPSPKQLANCPACGQLLVWEADQSAEAIRVKCKNPDCILFSKDSPLPVHTVDTDVYRERPTLLIGTVDKFSQIVRKKETNRLFGISTTNPPDLIIQDELHLISGPLGTLAGLYEVAIDRMFTQNGSRPKIIGSTATIRRAEDQIRALFDRDTCQFPPPAIDADDSGFAVVDKTSPGRKYVGITTTGRSAKFSIQAVSASLLQSAYAGISDDRDRDPYWTLISYFNSLRELGGALVLMQDDVNDSISTIADRRSESRRTPQLIQELTSRRTQIEVREMLDLLSYKTGDPRSLDIVLATNMISVGVDIPRLGLMLINGQPKGISEYIQATSRVGRGKIPGLIVAVLNNAKARDRSHYESFETWHSTLYRDVEATSVTPFASRARDRALHAVLVALIRHLTPSMLDKPSLNGLGLPETKEIIDYIIQRAENIDPDEKAVCMELRRLLASWERRQPRDYWTYYRSRTSLLQDAEKVAILRALGRDPGEAWSTMNNMRSVEPSTRFRLRERLKDFSVEEGQNGR